MRHLKLSRPKSVFNFRNWLFLSLFFLAGCGYRWTEEGTSRTVSIPYATGDENGLLTSELIYAVASSGCAEVVGERGQYQLDVAIVHHQNDVIGYKRDPQQIKEKTRKNLVANEACKVVSADVTLYEGNKILFGPKRIEALVDYDYVDGDSLKDLVLDNTDIYHSIPVQQTVLAFSLGQLEPQETALDAANRPLYRKLAQKIVDVIYSQW